jgi:hypothetical protein
MGTTKILPTVAELAFHYANKDMWFAMDKIFVPFPVDDPEGQYSVDGALDWYKFYEGKLSKAGYPEEVKMGNAYLPWKTRPIGLSYKLEIRKLNSYRSYSYVSKAQMEQRKWEYLANAIKINREVLGKRVIETDANYEASQIYTIGAGSMGSVWSGNLGTPIDDVAVIKLGNRWLTDMAFNYKTLVYLMKQPSILDAIAGDGPHPDKQSPVETQLGWLSSVFGLRCHVFMAEAVQNNIDDPTTQSKTDIWGNYVWFGRVDTESTAGNLEIPTWAHEFKLTDPEGMDRGGFTAVRTVDERAGSRGWMNLDLKYDNQLKVYAKPYGARLDGVY